MTRGDYSEAFRQSKTRRGRNTGSFSGWFSIFPYPVMLFQTLGDRQMRRRGMIGRLIGAALLFGALITLAMEALGWWLDGAWEIVSLGAAWASVNANSLVGLGAFVEKSISPWLWMEIMVPLLTLPLWLYLVLPGAALLIFSWRERRHSIF